MKDHRIATLIFSTNPNWGDAEVEWGDLTIGPHYIGYGSMLENQMSVVLF